MRRSECKRTLHARPKSRLRRFFLAEAAAAQSQLRKATAYASSLTAARAVADEKARKLREAADHLAPPKSD